MSIQYLYRPVWEKFFPVIHLKLKSALRKQESEFLVMDRLDFEKASRHKNSNFMFRVELNEGRILKSKTTSAVGIEFARALKDSEVLFALIKELSIVFSLNNKFVLSIVPQFVKPQEAVEDVVEEKTEVKAGEVEGGLRD